MSRFSLRTLVLSFSSLVLRTQLSRPPTCSTERRPCVETRSFTLWPSASERSVTFCRFGRNVRLVLLLAWETLLPTCRPLPVSSHTRDMIWYPDLIEHLRAPGKRRPLAAGVQLVNVAEPNNGGNSHRLAALMLLRSPPQRSNDHARHPLHPDPGRARGP